MNITVDTLLKTLASKKYQVFSDDSKDFNLNIIGIRSSDNTPNVFNDAICVMWKFKDTWTLRIFEATTDPGLYWLLNPLSKLGTAIVKPNQYPGLWKLGLHKGYVALVQKGNVTVIRDYDKDGEIDYSLGREETGSNFGINCHRASDNAVSISVDKWSAGCQVLRNKVLQEVYTNNKPVREYDYFISLCKQATTNWGNSFTYTLLNEADLVTVSALSV